MFYESHKDMLLDNRWGMVDNLKEEGAPEAFVEIATRGYDWMAVHCLENEAAYRMEIKEKETGEHLKPGEMFFKLTKEGLDYINDVNNGRRVGYSAVGHDDDDSEETEDSEATAGEEDQDPEDDEEDFLKYMKDLVSGGTNEDRT